MIELLQLLGLCGLIALAFKYFFLSSPPSNPKAAQVPSQPPLQPKKDAILEVKYAPPNQSIQQVEKQSQQEDSIVLSEVRENLPVEIKVHFQAEEKSFSFNNAQCVVENESKVQQKMREMISESKQQIDQQRILSFQESQEELIHLEKPQQQNQIQLSVPIIDSIEIVQPNSQPQSLQTKIDQAQSIHQAIKAYEDEINRQSSDPIKPIFKQNFDVKDVISQCEEHSYVVEEVHSNARRIQISEMQMNVRNSKLRAVKEHYKSIIQDLKQKLQEICIRHNESLSEIDVEQTITFEEGESSYLEECERGQLQMKVEEVENLKNELQLHEDIITTIIEEESKLKDQMKSLETQNQTLKTALRQSMIQQSVDMEDNGSNLGLSQNRSRIKSVQSRFEEGEVFRSQLKNSQVAESRILEMYTSQIIGKSPLKSSIIQSQIFPKQSTILMMSLIEGAISIGMLGECRFLNEISKKFAIGQIKKLTKQRVTNAQLVYEFNEQNGDYDASIFAMIEGYRNLLFLIKMTNRSIAVYSEQITNGDRQGENDAQTKFLLVDLTKRKSYSRQGICKYDYGQIVFGNQELQLSEFPPFTLNCGQWVGQLELDQKVTNIAVFSISLQSQE